MPNSADEEIERYEQIRRVESYQGYADKEDFIAIVEDEQFAKLLEIAMNGLGVFGRFKDVLGRYPDEKERWLCFKSERIEEPMLEWLDDISRSPAQNWRIKQHAKTTLQRSVSRAESPF